MRAGRQQADDAAANPGKGSRSGALPGPSRATAILWLVALPFLVHLPALCGWLSADPLFRESALSIGPVDQILSGFPGWIDGNAGVTTQALGHLAAESWLGGRLPWWNPYAGLGMPLAAEMQNSALFLPFVLLLHFANGVLYLKLCMQVLTGLAMLALLDELGLDRRAALTGAVLMEFCGTLAWFSHGPIMPVPFLPLLVLGIERTARLARERRRGGWTLVALAIAGSIAAGFPETAFMNGLLALCVAGWRVASAGPVRFDVAGRILLGGIVGLLLSAPAWLPFAESLPVSFLGQNADIGGAHLMRSSYGLLLLPYLLGPLLYGPERIGDQAQIWWHTGGYCDLLLLFAALVGLFARGTGRQTGLRRVLGAWLVLSLLKAAGLPVVTQAFNLIPFVRQTMFYIYASPGWEFALALLAALALDDLRRGHAPPERRLLAIVMGCLLATVLAVALAWPPIHQLGARLPNYWPYPVLSAAWAASTLTILYLALRSKRRGGQAAAILSLDAVLLFALPLLSGTRHGQVDQAPLAYLRQHQGLGRAYSMFVLQPNYGSYFEVATLNYNAVPVPSALTRRIGRDLDPQMDLSGLFGDGLHDLQHPETHSMTAPVAIAHLEAMGVSDLLVPRGFDPLQETIAVGPSGTLSPLPLSVGEQFAGTFLGATTADATVTAIGLVVGTYKGHPHGALRSSFCVAGQCVSGRADLADAVDNQPLWFELERSIALPAGAAITYRVSVLGLDGSAAFYVSSSMPPSLGTTQRPAGRLRVHWQAPALVRTYRDASMDVLRLPEPAPYFQSFGGHCRLLPHSREAVTADCDAPDRLIRRELFFPGWRAWMNGRTIVPTAFEDSLQSVPLRVGHNEIRFHYTPPHVVLAWLACLLGLLLAGLSQVGGMSPPKRNGDHDVREPVRASGPTPGHGSPTT